MGISPDARRELITKKAYELYVKKGKKPGHELEDWLEAERLVDRDLQEVKKETHSEISAGPRPIPQPIRNAPAKVGGFKRVSS